MKQNTYCVVGLGKLGACMAAAIADGGHRVIGVDHDEDVVARVAAGQAPVVEPGLGEMLRRNAGRIDATTDTATAVAESDATFVVVPTPSEPDGSFSLIHARRAMGAVGAGLARARGYHLVVMTSTVLPGATRHGLVPVLEQSSGLEAGRDFGVCYSPEFIALGSVIHDFLNPDFTLVGELDARSGEALENAYRAIIANDAPCRRMSLENAELAKVALNTYVTTKITFANMLAELCERLPGGDVDVVADALGLDRRIGRRYLTGATAYGGPCFPRDNHALGFLARALGTSAELAETTDRVNRRQVDRLLGRLGEVRGVRVSVLGLAYKPDTPVVEEAAGLMLVRALAAEGAEVRAYDPMAGPDARGALDGAADVVGSLEAALAGAEVVVVTTPDPAFDGLTEASFEAGARVYDAWRRLGHLAGSGRIRYTAVGRGEGDLESNERLARLWGESVEVR
jgi:UDPglucose 6-dehydrogenase